jgi:RNase P/RNase MRP subunit p30
MIETKNLEEARKTIDKLYKEKKKVVVKGKDAEFNRKILENKKVNILILEHENKRDKLKQRDSGLNQVLCKIARDNNIIIAFDFNEIAKGDSKEKAILLSRIIQNIKLCKKFKTKFILINISDKDKTNLFNLLLTLGCDTKTAQEALI